VGEGEEIICYDYFVITSKYLVYAREYGLYVGLVALGIGMMIGGMVLTSSQTKDEYNPAFVSEADPVNADSFGGEVVVDVAGAVISPGVYRLPGGSRVAEALAAAGGFLAEADADFVARQINLADVLKDGAKIYIPARGVEGFAADVVSLELVSLNSATQAELEELWGVGEARARAIIDNRPYSSVEELVSRLKLPQSVLDKNQGKIGL
jgi:competence protein ComEA